MDRIKSIHFLRWEAAAEIDIVAGEARLRYITDAPGQESVYIVKLQQAQAYLDDQAAVPPYIAAEATATGLAPFDAALAIVAASTAWNDQKGPAIECARLTAKRAIQSAGGPEAVAAALQTGVDVLRNL